MIGRRAGEIFGVEPAAYVGKPSSEVLTTLGLACDPQDAFLKAATAEAAPDGTHVAVEVQVIQPRPRTVLCRGMNISREGRSLGRVVFVRDVTRERVAEAATRHFQARLTDLTPVDPLTGLPNEKRLREELVREHARSSRAWDSYAVLRLNVDGTAAIQAELGFQPIEQLLGDIAGLLRPCLRGYDVLARLRDESFGVLLPGADGLAARTVAERMAEAVASADLGLPSGRRVTVSVGAALWLPPSEETGDDIIRNAEQAVREAHRLGGDRVYIHGA